MKVADEERRAGDMVGKGSSMTELLLGSISGMAFGLVSPIAGQPFDVVKTKMQADARFTGESPMNVVRSIMRTEGLIGMYRGMLPILASTGVQKTVLFTANAGARRSVERSGISVLVEPIPGTAGLKPSVLIGGVAASAARTVVETPFELMKVRLQTGGSIRTSGGESLLSIAQASARSRVMTSAHSLSHRTLADVVFLHEAARGLRLSAIALSFPSSTQAQAQPLHALR